MQPRERHQHGFGAVTLRAVVREPLPHLGDGMPLREVGSLLQRRHSLRSVGPRCALLVHREFVPPRGDPRFSRTAQGPTT